MKILKGRTLGLIFLLVFAGLTLARLPFSLVSDRLSALGLSYDHQSGSLWQGVMENVRGPDMAFQQVTYQMAPLSLLGGAVSLSIIATGERASFRGQLSFEGNLITATDFQGLEDRSLMVAGNALPITVQYRGKTLTMAMDQHCVAGSAEMTIRINHPMLKDLFKGMDAIAGSFQCDQTGLKFQADQQAGDWQLLLSGSWHQGGIVGDIRLTPDQAAAETIVIANLLRQTGFQKHATYWSATLGS